MSKKRHAKRIFSVRQLAITSRRTHLKIVSDNLLNKPRTHFVRRLGNSRAVRLTLTVTTNVKPSWEVSENTIDLFIERDLAIDKIANKCQLEFMDTNTKDNATMGHIRHKIAKSLGNSDVFTIQLESSTPPAKPSTFKARGTICDRVNAIWDELEPHDQKTVKEVFENVKAPWLRVRKTKYIIIALPKLKLEVRITPSDVAVVGELRRIAAALTRNNMPRSFHVSIENVEFLEDEDEIRFLDIPIRHKSVITCVPEVHECSICAEDVGFLDWPGKLNAKACEHESSTCTSCLRNWITEALDNNNFDNITCPECEAVFEHNDLKKHTTEGEFAR